MYRGQPTEEITSSDQILQKLNDANRAIAVPTNLKADKVNESAKPADQGTVEETKRSK